MSLICTQPSLSCLHPALPRPCLGRSHRMSPPLASTHTLAHNLGDFSLREFFCFLVSLCRPRDTGQQSDTNACNGRLPGLAQTNLHIQACPSMRLHFTSIIIMACETIHMPGVLVPLASLLCTLFVSPFLSSHITY